MANYKADISECIHLKVLALDGSEVKFKLKKNTPLKKLMNAYCDKIGLIMRTVSFCFNGQRIGEADTPSSLEMIEQDTIEVFQNQIGGSFYFNYY